MPDQEIMREWVRRLRSGGYRQGRNRLRLNDEFCCLGVLCDLAVDRNVIDAPMSEWVNTPVLNDHGHVVPVRAAEYHYYSPATGYYSMSQLPRAVRAWADIPTDSHLYPEARCDASDGPCVHALHVERLVSLNDTGTSFADIADLIESEWIEPLPAPDYTVPDSPADIAEEAACVDA